MGKSRTPSCNHAPSLSRANRSDPPTDLIDSLTQQAAAAAAEAGSATLGSGGRVAVSPLFALGCGW